MSTTVTGRTAETIVCEQLERLGYTIVDRNWRNRWCELDIVVRRDGLVQFVEVKYRRSVSYGYAAEYVTADKINRLKRAALAWNQAHRYSGGYQIGVATVEGVLTNPRVAFLPNAITD